MQKTLMPVVQLGLGTLLALGQSSRPAASKATPPSAVSSPLSARSSQRVVASATTRRRSPANSI